MEDLEDPDFATMMEQLYSHQTMTKDSFLSAISKVSKVLSSRNVSHDDKDSASYPSIILPTLYQ